MEPPEMDQRRVRREPSRSTRVGWKIWRVPLERCKLLGLRMVAALRASW